MERKRTVMPMESKIGDQFVSYKHVTEQETPSLIAWYGMDAML